MELWIVQNVNLRRRALLPSTVRAAVGKKQRDAGVGDQKPELVEKLSSILQRQI